MALDLLMVSNELDLLNAAIIEKKRSIKKTKIFPSIAIHWLQIKIVESDIKQYRAQHKALKAYLNTIAKFT